jgi:hypothetical protein
MLFTSILYQIAIIYYSFICIDWSWKERGQILYLVFISSSALSLLFSFIYVLGVFLFGFKIERTYMGLFIVTIFHVAKV